MRRHPLLLAGLLVLSAGCSGIGSLGGNPSESVTPAPVPESATDRQARSDPPPGIGEAGIERVQTLAAGHRMALWNRSYTFYERYEETTETSNGTVTLLRNEATRVAGPRRYLHRLHRQRYRANETLGQYEQTEFADGERWYERRDDGTVTETSGTLQFTQDQFAAEAAFYIERYVTVSESQTRRVRWNGAEYFRVTGSNGTSPAGRDVQSYTVSLVVDSEGLVHRLDVRYRTETATISYSFWYRRVDQTGVQSPSWVGDRHG
ncbi:hypothetical protein [Haloarcula pellucida]|uniref:hypothetical protein n=1 Tax=Haloarcula pellucida TaxID=1427151 RepID=UPI00166CA609|nr:hypothetical protein [Halomicroarcula pellucida]MBX0347097.1 hypothetical protein [Halomicroarcula pellucida]